MLVCAIKVSTSIYCIGCGQDVTSKAADRRDLNWHYSFLWDLEVCPLNRGFSIFKYIPRKTTREILRNCAENCMLNIPGRTLNLANNSEIFESVQLLTEEFNADICNISGLRKKARVSSKPLHIKGWHTAPVS